MNPRIEITIKNYRCFEDKNSVKLDVGSGFTALVGQNNAGKTAFLKMFHELSGVFKSIPLRGKSEEDSGKNKEKYNIKNFSFQSSPIQGVDDEQEVFCNSNRRGITLICKKSSKSTGTPECPELTEVHLSCDHEFPNYWNVKFHWHPNTPDFHNSPTSTEVGPQENKKLQQTVKFKSYKALNFLNVEVADYSILSWLYDLANPKNLYFPAFRSIIGQSMLPNRNILLGQEFISSWRSWKVGPTREHRKKIIQITEDIRRLLEFDSLQINSNETLDSLELVINNKPYSLRELGDGLGQLILVLANAGMGKPEYIFIDEPELNLHPSLQIDFLMTLASYAKEGIIFSTHSLGLARAISSNIYSFEIGSEGIRVNPFEDTQSLAEFAGALGYSGYKSLGFSKILLAEGVTDVKTIHQFLRMVGKDHQVVVIPLGGDQLIKEGTEVELNELTRICKNISVLVDSERENENEPLKRERKAFKETCERLGFKNICLTKKRAIENYFTEEAIKAGVGEEFGALGDFGSLKKCELGWSKNENWRIARKMEWSDIANTDIGKFLQDL